jgi:hypothetical protein
MTLKSALASLSILTCCATTACGSADDERGHGDEAVTGDPTDPEAPPAGSLPNGVLSGTNGTMPCTPSLDTGFEGDTLCILPAEPGTGAFFHAGPDDYDDPEQVARFILAPGEESTEYHVTESNNDDMVWFRDQHYRMRPGSHHLIMYTLTATDADPPEVGWHPEATLDRGGPIGGTQVYAMDFPEGGQVAPEDVNLVRPLGARTRLAFEMHYVNPGEQTILREAWVNLMQNDVPPEDRIILGAPFLVGGSINVPPQTTQILNYEHAIPDNTDNPDVPIEMRIVSFFGHRHASTSRFSIWLKRSGARDLVYEDYDWQEAKEFFYNSLIQNPLPDPATGTAGAVSGQVFVQSGDVLEWECQMTNTMDVNLTFGNGVYDKEMCNVFGTLTSTGPIILFGFKPATITTL